MATSGNPSKLIWRPPKSLNILGHIVEVKQVTVTELKDLVSDHDDECNDGAWRSDTETIYLDKRLPNAKKNRAFYHELMHVLIDLFDSG